jgi:GMP synthase (glutamine-hydrolysing)
MEPRVLVVQNDLDKPLGRIAAALLQAGVELDVRMSTGELPDVAGYDGLITLPGLADPDDDEPEVHRARAVTEQALACGKPVLGVCLGGQLLVQALGGETYRSRNELGFRDVVRTPAGARDALLCDVPDRFSALHAHCYGFRPPPGAVVLLENDVCVQACRLGSAWAFQCHPEATAEWIEALALGMRGATSALDPRTIAFFTSNDIDPDTLEHMGREADDVAELVAGNIARGFAAAARARSRQPTR